MQLRTTNLDKLRNGTFDVLVIGGGINGAVSSAALSARGAKVALVDRGDFAGRTSQESSNLAWGGIKYLETLEFGLVRKLCKARNRLLRTYPSTVQEIRFYTTIARGFRHGRLKLFLGALLYWFIGSFFTRGPRLLTRRVMEREEPIINLEGSVGGFEYSDAFLHDNDARFTFNFIRSALSWGCVGVNYVEVTSATRGSDGLWRVLARDVMSGATFELRSRVIINAAGPFADELNDRAGQQTSYRHVLSKGIHIIVDRVTPNRRVLTFFADDGRLFFVIPMGPRTCIGTTDTRVESADVGVTPEDRRFVLDNINARLKLSKPLTEADIIAERCGVRPLAVKNGGSGSRDWMQLSRKHAVEVNPSQNYVAIFGGKLTDCLNVGEEICDEAVRLGIELPHRKRRWYGEPPDAVRDEFFHQARLMNLDGMTAPTASEPLSQRLWRRYGAAALAMLENIRADPRQAEVLIEGTEYIRCEIEQAARREMITTLDDFLRRRSKIAQVVRRDELRKAAGLREACEILFGDEADAKIAEYFGDGDGQVNGRRRERETPLSLS